jgi:hypothetical protein
MGKLTDDYLGQVERSLETDPSTRDQVIQELRGAMDEKLGALARERPEAPIEDLEKEILNDFGSPTDLALAYGPEGVHLRRASGEIALKLGRAVGRGTKQIIKWGAIVGAVALLLGIGLGIWAFYEAAPYVEGIVERQVYREAYSVQEFCSPDACNGQRGPQSFALTDGARQVRLDVDIDADHAGRAGGSVEVLFLDPTGQTKYARTFNLTSDAFYREELRWEPVEGEYTVSIEYHDFVGEFGLIVSTIGGRI